MNIFVQILGIALFSTLLLIGCFMLQERLLRWIKGSLNEVTKSNMLELWQFHVTSKYFQEEETTTHL